MDLSVASPFEVRVPLGWRLGFNAVELGLAGCRELI
jgi:hypothetical protein